MAAVWSAVLASLASHQWIWVSLTATSVVGTLRRAVSRWRAKSPHEHLGEHARPPPENNYDPTRLPAYTLQVHILAAPGEHHRDGLLHGLLSICVLERRNEGELKRLACVSCCNEWLVV